MPTPDTTMGGGQDAFPETAWSKVLSTPEADRDRRAARLNELLERYWRPVYKYIRAAHRAGVEDAKDLTQGFFCHLLEDDAVPKYEAAKGRFRHFLKGILKNYLAEERRSQGRLKRGGGTFTGSLDVGPVEAERFLADPRQPGPDELFDRQWAREIMARSLDQLRRELVAERKEVLLAVYEAYELAAERPTYDQLAATFGLQHHDVRNYLERVRARLHALLLANVADSVTSREEAAGEMRDLFS